MRKFKLAALVVALMAVVYGSYVAQAEPNKDGGTGFPTCPPNC
jgi:hypothetical protein